MVDKGDSVNLPRGSKTNSNVITKTGCGTVRHTDPIDEKLCVFVGSVNRLV